MQLMLLEQQNKKRLLKKQWLMARQESLNSQSFDQLGAIARELREFKGETNTIVVG